MAVREVLKLTRFGLDKDGTRRSTLMLHLDEHDMLVTVQSSRA